MKSRDRDLFLKDSVRLHGFWVTFCCCQLKEKKRLLLISGMIHETPGAKWSSERCAPVAESLVALIVTGETKCVMQSKAVQPERWSRMPLALSHLQVPADYLEARSSLLQESSVSVAAECSAYHRSHRTSLTEASLCVLTPGSQRAFRKGKSAILKEFFSKRNFLLSSLSS